MAKTIVEMAEEYGRRNPSYAVDKWGNWSMCDHERPKYCFLAGANAVLEEIWDYISELPCKSKEEADNQKMLLARIQKLKNG